MRRLIKRVLLSNVVSFSHSFFNIFKSRVIWNSGVVEADSCAVTTLSNLDSKNLLQSATFVLAPSGYKSGVIYSQVPSNGNGDLTFTRGSAATRTNESGVIESVASGVQRLDYSLGGCPVALYEPQRTNSIRNNTMVGAVAGTPGTDPTNWTFNTRPGLTKEIVGTGTEKGLPYVDVRYSGTPSSSAFFLILFEGTNVIAATSGQTWAYSFYYKKVSGTIPTNAIQAVEYNASGVFLAQGGITANLNTITTLTRISGTRTLNNASTAFTGVQIRIDVVSGTAYDWTMRFYAPQIELGAYTTTWIPTNGTSATRNADSYTRDNIYTNGLISASGGTWFVELKNNQSVPTDVAQAQQLGLGNNVVAAADNIWIGNSGSSINRVWKQVAGAISSLYILPSGIIKLAITWDGLNVKVYANGSLQITSSFTPTALETLRTIAVGTPFYIQQMALWNTHLSEAQCISLTS